jgi:hypothetical protein
LFLAARKPVVKGVIERVLPGGTVAIRNGDDLLFAKRNERGYYEETNEQWDNPEYESLRRAELLPNVGDKTVLRLTAYNGCDGDGREWAQIVLQGTVKAVDAQGRCNIQIAKKAEKYEGRDRPSGHPIIQSGAVGVYNRRMKVPNSNL